MNARGFRSITVTMLLLVASVAILAASSLSTGTSDTIAVAHQSN